MITKISLQKINTMGLGTFRLPTEAEWEYACRAGSTTRFPWGDDPDYNLIGQYAWYKSNSESKTHTVGQKKPNAWGLYDMHGNVWEWCLDWYAAQLSGDTVREPVGPSSGTIRVFRGGGWDNTTTSCRSAFRSRNEPGYRYYDRGFRLALSSVP